MFLPDCTTGVTFISKAELFAQTFADNSTLDDLWLVSPSPPHSDYIMSFVKILWNDVFHDPRKACIPDGVPVTVLQNCASVLSTCLVKTFRLCLSFSTFPSCWKFARFQPVSKKVELSNSSKYRAIALTSCLSKSFQCILRRRFSNMYATTISSLQYGLLTGFCTEAFIRPCVAYVSHVWGGLH